MENDDQQTVILHNYVTWEVQRVRFIESQNNKIVTLVQESVRNSVIARFRYSGSL